MKRLGTLLLLVALFAVGCAVTSFTMRPTVNSVAQTAVNHLVAPDPLDDIMSVRQQAQTSGGKFGWLLAGLLLFGLFSAGVLVAMGRFPKMVNAWRRARRPHRPLLPQQPNFRQLPQQPVGELQRLQRPSPVQSVPDWTDGTYD